MSQARSISADRRYGLVRVCRVWRRPRSTVHHQRRRQGCLARRRGPLGPCGDGELSDRIRQTLAASPFHGEGHRKVWAQLRLAGVRTSKRRVLRLLRENNLLAPVRRGRPHGPRAHDRKITTERPNEMWGTDMTLAVTTGEGLGRVFVTVDHCGPRCLGLHAAKAGTRFEALEPIRQAVTQEFGRIDAAVAGGLKLRHDHGSQYMSDDFQQEITSLGLQSSPAFVAEPEGNSVAEWFIRILKENLLWVRFFKTIEELRLALLEFKTTYNEKWILEKYGYRTPNQVYRDACLKVAA
jgi:transposase InsO family protein